MGWAKQRWRACLLLCLAVSAAAEQPVVRFFSTEDGLVRNWITRIRRDTRGRLWFCTVEGLSLFDGERFINYTVADGLPNRLVNDFLDAGNGTYWLATNSGVAKFRPRDGRGSAVLPGFTAASLGGAISREANVLMQSRSGDIWCGTSDGVFRKPKDAEEYAQVQKPAITGVLSLAESDDASIWIGTLGGLFRLKPDGELSRIPTTVPNARVKALLVDGSGRLWAASDTLRVYDIRGGAAVEAARYGPADGAPFHDVQALYESHSGEIWAGGFGLARLRPGGAQGRLRISLFDRESALGTQNIATLVEDAAGNLWAGISTMGAARILRPAFSFFTEADGLHDRFVLSVFQPREGPLIAVTGARHVLNQFDGERFLAISPRWPRSINYFGWGEGPVTIQDRRGEWWMATGNGLVRFPAASAADLSRTAPKAIYKKREGVPGECVLRLFEDPRGDLWVGGDGGLARWNTATQAFEDLTAAANATLGHIGTPQSFAVTPAGEVWIGMYPAGLLRQRAGGFEKVRDAPDGTINTLLLDGAGHLWIGSSRGGLGRVDSPDADVLRIRHYTMADGLASNHIFALAEDRAGHIYIAGGQGVDRLHIPSEMLSHFRSGTGLPPAEVQRLYCDRQGAIWFASDFGVSRYLPEPDSTEVPPAPGIQSVRVSGVPVMVSDEGDPGVDGISLPSGDKAIEIAYGAADFWVDRKLRYQFRLMPIESEWRRPTGQRSVQYARLGPAEYRFEVRTISSTGVASATNAMLAFRVEPAVWRRTWFLLLAAVTLASLAAMAHTYRVRQVLAMHRIRTRLAADLHDEVGAGLAEIAILAEVTRQRHEPDGETLNAVADRARELRGSMSDIVWSVDPARDHLTDLVRRLRESADGLLGNTHAIEFVAPPDEAMDGIDLTAERRRHLLLLFKEAITNIARHAAASAVKVEICLRDAELTMTVTDDGRGFSKGVARSGQGLAGMAYRAQEIGGSLEVESGPGRGTSVCVRLPLA